MTEQEFDRFLSDAPNLLVAPAGYGKTHSIAKAVKRIHEQSEDTILVLTHTNAGITSIREKFKKEKVNSKGVSILTIAGFLQKIVHSLSKNRIVQGNDTDEFYNKLYEEAYSLFQNNRLLKKVIENSYRHIFVDEFQDCNKVQYDIIGTVAKWNVKVHCLLDPLQTIFDFEKDHPDYLSWVRRCSKSSPNRVFELKTPYRWRNAKSNLETKVPNWRKTIFDAIVDQTYPIDLEGLAGATYKKVNAAEFYPYMSSLISNNDNILVLHSHSQAGNISIRGQIAQKTGYRLRLIESIDNPDFYATAETIDNSLLVDESSETIICSVLNICKTSTSCQEKWIKNNRLVVKQGEEDAKKAERLRAAISNPSKKLAIANGLSVLTKEIGLKVQRIELLNDIIKALISSESSGKNIKLEIELKRNIARIQGRKLYGKVIGTTLLTKGLEADTVVLINPSNLLVNKSGLMHLYVALTRAVNKVILVDYK